MAARIVEHAYAMKERLEKNAYSRVGPSFIRSTLRECIKDTYGDNQNAEGCHG